MGCEAGGHEHVDFGYHLREPRRIVQLFDVIRLGDGFLRGGPVAHLTAARCAEALCGRPWYGLESGVRPQPSLPRIETTEEMESTTADKPVERVLLFATEAAFRAVLLLITAHPSGRISASSQPANVLACREPAAVRTQVPTCATPPGRTGRTLAMRLPQS